MNNQEINLLELSKKELISINGGQEKESLPKRFGRWLGDKIGFAMDVLSKMDWTGSPLGY